LTKGATDVAPDGGAVFEASSAFSKCSGR
jgi:hypothetical protein